MSNLLNEKHALAKLRTELEGRKEKICWCCKKFEHLAQNCRNREGEEKRKVISQNKFEMLSNRVIRYMIELKRQETEKMGWIVKCFKYEKERHKYRKLSD